MLGEVAIRADGDWPDTRPGITGRLGGFFMGLAAAGVGIGVLSDASLGT